MVQNGVSLQELQHLLGHSSIEMSLRYAHFQKQDATAKAAAILNKQNEAIA
jgi:site-specific recombinase XerD